MYIPLRPIPREDLDVDVFINWSSERNWLTKVLNSWKVTQRIYFVRKVLSPTQQAKSVSVRNFALTILRAATLGNCRKYLPSLPIAPY